MEPSHVLWHLVASIWNNPLVQTALILCFPLLLRHLPSLLGSHPSSAAAPRSRPSPPPQTRWQAAARWAALAFALLEIYRAWDARSADVFCEVRPLPDNAAFAWHFQRYVDKQAAADPAGFKAEEAEWFRARGEKSRWQHADDGGTDQVPGAEQETTRAGRLLTLKEVLADRRGRTTYYTFGEEAALQCPCCSKPSDYLAFRLPTQILHYALAAAVVGAATAPRRKRGWRAPLVAALFVAAAVDLYFLLDDEGALLRKLPCSLPTKASFVRHGLFASFALAVAAARGRDDVRTDAEIVAALCERERSFLHRSQASFLLHEAINGDSNLRKSQNSHCLHRELERNLLAADEEVVSAKERAKQRFDLAKVIADVEGYVERVVRAGTGVNQTGDLMANSWR